MGAEDSELEDTGQRERLLSRFKEDSSLVKAVSQIAPEIQLMDEAALARAFKPTPLDYALKKQLWSKFYEAEKLGTRLKMVDIFDGLCTNQYFYNELIKNPIRVSWLVTPPMNTEALVEEAFRFSFQRVRDDILTMAVTEKSAPILLKAFQIFADRHLGPVVQRIESKNLNVDVDGGSTRDVGAMDPYEIETKLRELKQKLIPTKDVTPQDE